MKSMEKESINKWTRALEGVDPKGKNAGVAARILRLTTLPKRKRVVVNLGKLDMLAGTDENIVVPGKILGTGTLGRHFHVSAIDCSEASEKKLRSAGCKIVSIEEMLKKENLKIIM